MVASAKTHPVSKVDFLSPYSVRFTLFWGLHKPTRVHEGFIYLDTMEEEDDIAAVKGSQDIFHAVSLSINHNDFNLGSGVGKQVLLLCYVIRNLHTNTEFRASLSWLAAIEANTAAVRLLNGFSILALFPIWKSVHVVLYFDYAFGRGDHGRRNDFRLSGFQQKPRFTSIERADG